MAKLQISVGLNYSNYSTIQIVRTDSGIRYSYLIEVDQDKIEIHDVGELPGFTPSLLSVNELGDSLQCQGLLGRGKGKDSLLYLAVLEATMLTSLFCARTLQSLNMVMRSA